MVFFRRPTYHRFEYIPRYYNPDKDPAEEFKRKFERERRAHRRPARPLIRWIVIFLLVAYAYLYLAGVFH